MAYSVDGDRIVLDPLGRNRAMVVYCNHFTIQESGVAIHLEYRPEVEAIAV